MSRHIINRKSNSFTSLSFNTHVYITYIKGNGTLNNKYPHHYLQQYNRIPLYSNHVNCLQRKHQESRVEHLVLCKEQTYKVSMREKRSTR